jgi:gamma-glutamyltranspeptidase / glutathione hydrolase
MTVPSPHQFPGFVVSYSPVASALGTRVLMEGGNAVDATVCTALALAVTYPQAGALGGGGFAMLRFEGESVRFLDYRETAPSGLRPAAFVSPSGHRSSASTVGGRSVAVPGTVAGLEAMHARYGSLPWAKLVEPVVELADAGVWLSTRQAAYLRKYEDALRAFSGTAESFLRDGRAPLPGTRFRQPLLAKTFERLAREGAREFYEGKTARHIVDAVRASGGPLSGHDLSSYEAKWREPLTIEAFGATIVSPSLPSSGGLVVNAALRLLEANGVDRFDTPEDPHRTLLLARCLRAAFAMRYRIAVDPDFASKEDRAEIEKIRCLNGHLDIDEIEKRYVFERFEPKSVIEGNHTTHFCVVDGNENIVSNTYSINTLFGSRMLASDAGFLLNNSIDDFQIGATSENWYGMVDSPKNALAPGRRPVGSMCPTVVMDKSGTVPRLVLGGSGGPTIPTMLVQVLLASLVDGLPLHRAVSNPRVHHQFLRPELRVEQALPQEQRRELRALNNPIVEVNRLAICAGLERKADGRHSGFLDPRFGRYDED